MHNVNAFMAFYALIVGFPFLIVAGTSLLDLIDRIRSRFETAD